MATEEGGDDLLMAQGTSIIIITSFMPCYELQGNLQLRDYHTDRIVI